MAAASFLRSPLRAKVVITIAAVGLIFGLFRVVLHQYVGHQLQSLAKGIPGCTGLRYTELSIPYFGLQCRLRDATLLFEEDDHAIVAQSVHIHRFRPGDPFPRLLEAALTGLTLPAHHPLLAPLKEELEAMGYHELAGDVQMQWARRGEALEAWHVEFGVRWFGAGEMDVAVQLDRVNSQGVALALANPVNWLLVMPAIQLVAAQCDLRDQGLFQNAIAEVARQQGRRPEAVRDALQRYLSRQVQLEANRKVRAVWRSLEAFSHAPGRIVLRTDLSEPVPLGQLWWMRQPRDMIQRLSLESRTGSP